MARRGIRLLFCLVTAAALVRPSPTLAETPIPPADKPLPDRIDFNRDVRPILSENCYFCHGFDKNKRKADLRLDTQDGLLSAHDGFHTVVPGKPGESELIRRIVTDDPDERMPDPKSNKRLSPREVAVLKKWVEQGAEYKGHWAFLKPVRPAVPAVADADFLKNPVDAFILARLNEEKLPHAPPADRVTLLRRVTFDLTGLPPTPAEVAAFAADADPGAYEKVVDRLLASPAFGERMALYWLDLVRYADTIGYHSDNPMNVSPYRDYVIHAFNTNKPFDRFTVEQLAGDLLPDAGIEQKVAAAYNRLLQTTEEGGAQPKEYEQKYLADRVRSVSTVWMGATMGCAQCHDHKFDPFKAKDFYALGAFFADVQEASIGRREVGMPVPSAEQEVALNGLEDAIDQIRVKFGTPTPELAAAQAEWEKGGANAPADWRILTPTDVKAARGTQLVAGPDGTVRASAPLGKFPVNETYTLTLKPDGIGVAGLLLDVLPDEAFPEKGAGLAANGNFVLTEVKVEVGGIDRKDRRAVKIARTGVDFEQDQFPVRNAVDGKADTGWAVLPQVGVAHTAVFEFDRPLVAESGASLYVTLDFASQFPQHQFGKFRLWATTNPAPFGQPGRLVGAKAALAVAPADRNYAQQCIIASYYRSIAPTLQPLRDEMAALEKRRNDLLAIIPKCLTTTTAGPRRTVRLLPRGNWQDESGPVVEPAVPESLGRLDADGRRLTRLDLAQWLVSKDNPLTARVFVNRLWKLYFGQGLSKVLDDLGSQGEWPTHPELLDWLAADFMDPSTSSGRASSGQAAWDVKRTIRLLVTSGAYRQSSTPTAEQKERDPFNRLYARQSRFRLDAEVVRDNALAVSGLLESRVGGPSAFPYQPAGYWFALNFPPREWKNDTGPGLYRRGLYTHWQRSFPHPSLLAFDAPSREEVVCERARSNIPQQALVLLNDPTYVEAARALAEGVLNDGDAAGRLARAFERVLSRRPTAQEAAVLNDLYAKHRAAYAADPALAEKLLAVGERPAPKGVDVADLAAWTSVARTILNLSETITRY